MTTPRTGAPELATSQANKEETVNEIARILEAGAGLHAVTTKGTTSPPGSPVDGNSHLLGTTPTGAWSGFTGGNIALYMGSAGWAEISVREGIFAYNQGDNKLYKNDGSGGYGAWVEYTGTIPTESLIVACSDETTDITTGNAKVTFRMPYAFTLSAVRASATTAPTGSTIIIDINESGSTILSTKLTIDAGEKTSTTAATPAVISDTSLADDAEITIDFDQVGSTIPGAGVKVALIGSRT